MQARLFTVVSVLLATACGAGVKSGTTPENVASAESAGTDGTGTEEGATTTEDDPGTQQEGTSTEGGADTDTDMIACVGEIEPRNNREVVLCNQLGEAVIASVSMPEGEPPVGGWPGVIVLHGSGGLFFSVGENHDDEDELEEDEDDEDDDDDEEASCTETLQHQFHDWAERLNERGYAVVMPASYYSRGFCEWGDDNAPEGLDKHESLILRTFDAAAAANYMCDLPSVDCSRLAVLGFSSGATVTLLFMHEHFVDAQDPRLYDLEDIPPIVGAVAYYPGCGLEGEITDEIDPSAVERYYYPRAPIWVPHAEKDSLLDDCEEVRDIQVDVVAQQHGVDLDMFDLHIYPDAKHGFDGSSEDDKQADFEASIDAQAKTLAKLESWF
jgi:dienelactone hydrolase